MSEKIDFTQLLSAEKIRLLFEPEDIRDDVLISDIVKLRITDPVSGQEVNAINFEDEWSKKSETFTTEDEEIINQVNISDLWNVTEGVNWNDRKRELSFTDNNIAQFDQSGCEIEGSDTVALSELTGDFEMMRLMDRVNQFGQVYDIKFRKINYGQYKYANATICTTISNSLGYFSVDKLINDEYIRKQRQDALHEEFQGTDCESQFPPYSGWLLNPEFVNDGWINIDQAIHSKLDDEFGYDSDASLAIQTRKFEDTKRILTLLILSYTSNILDLRSNNKVVDFGIRVIDRTTGQIMDLSNVINKSYDFIGQNVMAIFSGKVSYVTDESIEPGCDPCEKIIIDKCTGDLQKVAQCEILGNDPGVSHELMPQFRLNPLVEIRKTREDILNTIDPIHWTTGTQDFTEETLPGITELREEFTERELHAEHLIVPRGFAYGAGEWNNGYATGGMFHNVISYGDLYDSKELKDLGLEAIAGATVFWGHASDPHAKREWFTNELPGWQFDCSFDIFDQSSVSYPCADTEVWNGTTWRIENVGPAVPRAFGLAGGKPECAVTAFGTRCVWGNTRGQNLPNTEIDYGFQVDVGLNPVIGSPVPDGFLVRNASDVYFWQEDVGWTLLSSATTPNVERHSVAGVMTTFCQNFGDDNDGSGCGKNFKKDEDFAMDPTIFSALKAFERDGGHRAAGKIGATNMKALPSQYNPKDGLGFNYDPTTGGQLNVGRDFWNGDGNGQPLVNLNTDYDAATVTAFDAVMGLPPQVAMRQPDLNFGIGSPVGNINGFNSKSLADPNFNNNDSLNQTGKIDIPTSQVQNWKYPIVRPDGTILFVDDSSSIDIDLLKEGDNIDNGWYEYVRVSGIAFNGSTGDVTLDKVSDADLSDTFESISWVRAIHNVPLRTPRGEYLQKSFRFEDGAWLVDPTRKYPIKTVGTRYVGKECNGLATGGKTSNTIFGCESAKVNIKYGYFDDSRYEEFDNSIINLVYENDGGAWIRRDNLPENVAYHVGVGDQDHAVFWGGIHASVEEENAFVSFPGCDDWYLLIESFEGTFHRFGVKGLDDEDRYVSFATRGDDDWGNTYWKVGDSRDSSMEGIEYSSDYEALNAEKSLVGEGQTWDTYSLDETGHITRITYASKDKSETENFDCVIFTGGESWSGEFIRADSIQSSGLPDAERSANLEWLDRVGYWVESINQPNGFNQYEATYRPDLQILNGFDNSINEFPRKDNYFLQEKTSTGEDVWKYSGHPIDGGMWIWSRPTPGETLYHPTSFYPYSEPQQNCLDILQNLGPYPEAGDEGYILQNSSAIEIRVAFRSPFNSTSTGEITFGVFTPEGNLVDTVTVFCDWDVGGPSCPKPAIVTFSNTNGSIELLNEISSCAAGNPNFTDGHTVEFIWNWGVNLPECSTIRVLDSNAGFGGSHPRFFVSFTPVDYIKEIWERHSFASGIGLEHYKKDPIAAWAGGPILHNSIWTTNKSPSTDTCNISALSFGDITFDILESTQWDTTSGWTTASSVFVAYNIESPNVVNREVSIGSEISVYGICPPCVTSPPGSDPLLGGFIPPLIDLDLPIGPINGCDASFFTNPNYSFCEELEDLNLLVDNLQNITCTVDVSSFDLNTEAFGPLPDTIYQQTSYGHHPRNFTYSFYITKDGGGLEQLLWGYTKDTFVERWRFPTPDTVIVALSANNSVFGEPMPYVKKNDGSNELVRFDEYELFNNGTLSVGKFVFPVVDKTKVGVKIDTNNDGQVDTLLEENPLFNIFKDEITPIQSGSYSYTTGSTANNDLYNWLNSPIEVDSNGIIHYYPLTYDSYAGSTNGEYFRPRNEIDESQFTILDSANSSSIRDRAALWPWCDLIDGDANNVAKPGQVTCQYDHDGNMWVAECVSRELINPVACNQPERNTDPLNRPFIDPKDWYPKSYWRETFRIRKINKKSELLFDYEITYDEAAGPEIVSYPISELGLEMSENTFLSQTALGDPNAENKGVMDKQYQISGEKRVTGFEYNLFGENLKKKDISLELWSNKPLHGGKQTWASEVDEKFSIFANNWKREVIGIDTKVSDLTAQIYPDADEFGPGITRFTYPFRHEGICEMLSGGIYRNTPTDPGAGSLCVADESEIWWYTSPFLITDSNKAIDNTNFFKQRSPLVRQEKLEGLFDGMNLIPSLSGDQSIEFVSCERFTDFTTGEIGARITRAVVAGPETYGIAGLNLGKSRGIDFNDTDVFELSGNRQDVLFDPSVTLSTQKPDYFRLLKAWPWNVLSPSGRQGPRGYTDIIDNEGNYWFAMGDPKNFDDVIEDFNKERYKNVYTIIKVNKNNFTNFRKTILAYTNLDRAEETVNFAQTSINSATGITAVLNTVNESEGARFREGIYEAINTYMGEEYYDLHVKIFEDGIPNLNDPNEPDYYREVADYQTIRDTITNEVSGNFFALPIPLDVDPLPLIVQDLQIVTSKDANCMLCAMCQPQDEFTQQIVDAGKWPQKPWIQHNHDEWIAPFTESPFAGPYSLDGFNVWLTAGKGPRWGTPIWSDVEDGKIWVSYRRQRVHVNEYRNHLVLMTIEASINIDDFANANDTKIPVYCTYDEFIFDLEDYEDSDNVKLINERSSSGADCTDNVLAHTPNNLRTFEVLATQEEIDKFPGRYEGYEWNWCGVIEVSAYDDPFTGEMVIINPGDSAPVYRKIEFNVPTTSISGGQFTIPSDVEKIALESWGPGGNSFSVVCNGLATFAAGGGGGGFARKIVDVSNLTSNNLIFTVGDIGNETAVYEEDKASIIAKGKFGNASNQGVGDFIIKATAGGNASTNPNIMGCFVTPGAGGQGFGGDINQSGKRGGISGPSFNWSAKGGDAGGQDFGGGEGSIGASTGSGPGAGAGNSFADGAGNAFTGELRVIFSTTSSTSATSLLTTYPFDEIEEPVQVYQVSTSACSGIFVCGDVIEPTDKYVEWATSFVQEYKSRRLAPNSGRKESKYYFKYDVMNTYDSNTYLQPPNVNEVEIVPTDWRRFQDGVGLGGDAPALNILSDDDFKCNSLNEYYVGQIAFGNPEQAVIAGGFVVTADGQLSETKSFFERTTTGVTFKWNTFVINPEDALNKNYRHRSFSPFYSNGENTQSDSTFGSILFDVSKEIIIERQGIAEFQGQNSVQVDFDPIPDFLPNKDKYSLILTPSDNVKVWWTNKTESGFTIEVEFDSWTGSVDWQIVLVDDLPSEQVDNEENLGDDEPFSKFQNL